MSKKDHYESLGVPRTASLDEIKKAYRKLSLQTHPDRNPGKGDGEEFKKISESYSVLSDPDQKRKYDNPIQNLFPESMFTSGFMDPTSSTNFFSNLFGGVPPEESSTIPQPTPNLYHKVLLTLEDFYKGKNCKFAISRKVQCKECDGQGGWGKKEVSCIGCNGEGVRISKRGYNSISRSPCIQCHGKKVKTVFDKVCRTCKTLGVVPQRVVVEAKFEAGARSGDRVVLKGMSDCIQGRPTGDVVVTASERSHRIYKRSSKVSNDLRCSIDITLRQSLCGFSAEITHLDGRIVEIKSDLVTPHGHKIVVQGEGIPRGKGCLEITPNVVFPDPRTVVPESVKAQLAEVLDVLENQ